MSAAVQQPLTSELHEMSNDQRVLRVLIVLTPAISVFATFAAAHQPRWWIFVPVLGLALACAIQPDSHLGLMLIVVIALFWLAAVDDRASLWMWVAAISLGAFHCACAATTVSASAAPFTQPMRLRWLHRAAIVAAITALAWCVQLAFDGRTFHGSATLFVVALLVLTGGALGLRARSFSRPEISRPEIRPRSTRTG